MTKKIKTYIVDSFTDTPFKGNPAGVCILDQALLSSQMQSIAKELGLSETAFIRELDLENAYSIRYFSPKMEIPLCGHATLASAKVLFESNPEMDVMHFSTIENIALVIRKQEDEIEMEFPIYDTIPQAAPPALLRALGVDEILNSEFNRETNILLLEIASSKGLRELSPDFEQLKRSYDSINGVLVTAVSNRQDFDFESRYFWPWSGTNEDPVTGGTHTFLTKYWSTRLHKKTMNAYQCSERSGFMKVTLLDKERLMISSQAQIILRGELTI